MKDNVKEKAPTGMSAILESYFFTKSGEALARDFRSTLILTL